MDAPALSLLLLSILDAGVDCVSEILAASSVDGDESALGAVTSAGATCGDGHVGGLSGKGRLHRSGSSEASGAMRMPHLGGVSGSSSATSASF